MAPLQTIREDVVLETYMQAAVTERSISPPASATEARSSSTTPLNPRTDSKTQAIVLLSCALLQVPIWGYPMNYGIMQDFFSTHPVISGSTSTLGVVGTTSNGVMYLSMPVLFSLLTRRWAHLRRTCAVAGILLATTGFVVSAYCTAAYQLVLAQGVLAALGSALLYTPTTLALTDAFPHAHRALALGLVLSAKNVTGATCPFLFQSLLLSRGFRTTMLVWALISAVLSLPALVLPASQQLRTRKTPWSFLRHRQIWIATAATALQSSGYGLPQTYLASYAQASAARSALLIMLFNAPGVISSSAFGWMAEGKAAGVGAAVSALASAGAALGLWGLAGQGSNGFALLAVFAVVFGFFAGGYSATWGGEMREMEKRAAEGNEAIDTGVVYGLLNGARGVGYVGGGLIGAQLLKVGGSGGLGSHGYGTMYGPVILYTGLSTLLGGSGVVFKWKRLLH